MCGILGGDQGVEILSHLLRPLRFLAVWTLLGSVTETGAAEFAPAIEIEHRRLASKNDPDRFGVSGFFIGPSTLEVPDSTSSRENEVSQRSQLAEEPG